MANERLRAQGSPGFQPFSAGIRDEARPLTAPVSIIIDQGSPLLKCGPTLSST